MNTVIVSADEAATLFDSLCDMCGSNSHSTAWHRRLGADPPRRFVVHTANIGATTCETCDGYRILGSRGPIDDHQGCWTCDGSGTVPAVVTLTVKCETCEGRRYQTTGDLFSGRDNGPCMTCMTAGYRPVGTATVKHCWPIVGTSVRVGVDAVFDWGDELRLETAESSTDITDQVVGTPTPGAFILELVDVISSSPCAAS